MKQTRSKIISSVLIVMMLMGVMVSSAVAAQVTVSVHVDGKPVKFPDAKPYSEDNRVMIPIRFVSEALGAKVSYNKERVVTIEQGTKKITMKVNSDTVTVDSVIKKLDVPARLQQNRTYVPLRFVSEALGAGVGWNQQKHLVTITTATAEGEKPTPTPIPGTSEDNNMFTKGFKWQEGYTKLAKILFVNNMKVSNGKLTFTLPKEAKATKFTLKDAVNLTPGSTYSYELGKGKGFISFTQLYPGRESQEGYSIALDSSFNEDLGKLFGHITNDAIVVNMSTAATLSEVQDLALKLN
ncbi:hypothetical protein GCM10010912_58440 [Paenibacillus albidus]|uniref:Copper amine oxidase-like N-terminal domain-containing protein n=1 Tax=Paenibacillus albidus TaxID=2041023 RepID=A0A917D0S6_9BACL|nr:copper amine oxidase N-terminal domain-containing protein [Paenibacillus albidus]GGG06111.1 hypothetical protein GCM10010912_58440 [Paenibacillus albidus]